MEQLAGQPRGEHGPHEVGSGNQQTNDGELVSGILAFGKQGSEERESDQ